MTTNCAPKDDNTVVLTKVIEGDEWAAARKKAFNSQKAKLNLKGFRKGQVPASVAKKMIPDDYVNYLAANALAQDALSEMVDEFNVKMIDRPLFDLQDDDADNEKAVLRFVCQVAPTPVLGQYKGFGIKKEEAAVTDEMIDEAIKGLQKRYAELEVVEGDEPAAEGDVVKIDFVGKMDGEEFDGGKGENVSVKLGSKQFIPGFEEQIEGMKKGETKDITVTFPAEYPAAELAGKEAVFTITLNDLEKEVLPELNEEFFSEVFKQEGINNIDDLKKDAAERIKAREEEKAAGKFMNDVVNAAVENAQVEIPAVMIDNEVDQMFKEFANQVVQSGFKLADYLALTGSSEEAMKEPMRPEAEKRVKTTLVLDAIAAAENLEVTQEKLDEEFKVLGEMYNMDADRVRQLVREEDLKQDLLRSAAVDFLEENQ
ncbi:MAG: trigger factor [Ileibacterium sp.]|nr:trigger factor [Ileibacterium sp.]